MEQQTGASQEEHQTAYCDWHPSVETRLSCSQCGRSICTQCVIQVSVGIRCPECGKATKMPTFDVQPTYYAKAVGVGVGVAIAAGELISRSVNAKRSNGLAYIAAGAVVGAFIIALPSAPQVGFFGLIVMAISVYTAVQRVK